MAIIEFKDKNISIFSYDDTQYTVIITDDGIYPREFNLRYIGKSNKPTQPVGLTDYSYMFDNRSDLETIDLSDWDMSEAVSIYSMFFGCTKLKEIIGIEDWDVSKVTQKSLVFEATKVSHPSWYKTWYNTGDK